MFQPRVSVVIPTLDEGAFVESAIESVRAASEVVVVDGGSRDGTTSLAAAAGARIIESSACRGRQLDEGARVASGDWLLFLHADTRLDPGWPAALAQADAETVGGAFRFAVDSARPAFRVIEAGVALRCRVLGLPYGDQAIFARRRAYFESGGFPHLPLMEDVAFVRRLRKLGKVRFLAPRALTSARRWERLGIVRTTAINWAIAALYATGYPAARLARFY